MSDRTPPPVLARPRADRTVRLSRLLWVASFLSGALLLVVAFVRRTRQFDLLRDFIAGATPGYDASAVDTTAALAYWGALAALAVLTLAELLLRKGAERRAGLRWVLLLVLAVHAAAALVGEAFVALGEGAVAFRWLLGAQLLFALAALCALTLRGRRSRRDEDAGSPIGA
jgi:hypothetical protein